MLEKRENSSQMAKSARLPPSRVIAKAIKVAAEMSSNCRDIKNRADVFPVRCSVTGCQKPPRAETSPAVVSFCQKGQSQVVPRFIKKFVVIQTNDESLKKKKREEKPSK